ncbi:MAG: DUF1045 domain-containing protein, partial [Acidobacteriota bacterium]
IGLIKRLNMLLDLWQRLGAPETVKIKLFTHYPTFALLILDSDYFIYPYGYATLGNFSPVLWFSKTDNTVEPMIKFLDTQYQRVKANAIEAKDVFEIRSHHFTDISRLYPFALYFIPALTSELYQFGTEVLGYDIRRRITVKDSRWQNFVGEAHDYGFHLTLCDVLYFLDKIEVENVLKEIKYLVHQFKPFELTELQLAGAFPDSNSLSIVMKDSSGSLEALHNELVHRVYRRAKASNYSLELTKLKRERDYQRSQLMIDRYLAPYILQRFHPHFTLLTNVAMEQQLSIYQELEAIFAERVHEQTIVVKNLAVMFRHKPDSRWIIAEEVDLV